MTTVAAPPKRSAPASAVGLVGWFTLCVAIAAIGARASIDAGTFYLALVRPAWAPPAWLFGPAWSVLYSMMAVAAWLVWRRAGFSAGGRALALFALQLIPNAAWSWLFFAAHSGPYSVFDITLLWLLVAATIAAFARIEQRAALLLLPYIGWVSFALVLNIAIWRLNPTLLS